MESTIEYKGIEFDVEYDFTPAQKEIMYLSDGSGQEGFPSQVDIISITYGEGDFTEILEGDSQEIEELIFEQLRD